MTDDTTPESPAQPPKKKLRIVSSQPSEPPRVDLIAAAEHYISLGFLPVPVSMRSKAALPGWQTMELGDDYARKHFGSKPVNIGLRLGEVSHGLCDIDLDCDEAVALAPHFLPATGAVFGRAGNPRSHYLYISTVYQMEEKANLALKDPRTKSCLCDLRTGGGGRVAQTVVPPSIHRSGEAIEWVPEADGVPSVVEADELVAAWRRLAFAALLVRHWPEEGMRARHHAASVVGGWLARNGLTTEQVEHLVRHVVELVGDPEAKDRILAATSAAEKHHSGDSRSFGHLEFEKVFGYDMAKAVRSHFTTHTTKALISEDALAGMFAEAHAETLRYVATVGWFYWNGRQWEKDDRLRHVMLVREMLREVSEQMSKPGVLGSAKIIDNVAKLARSEHAFTAELDDFDADEWLLNTPKGCVDLRTGKIREHDSALLMSKITGCSPDPKMKTPVWDAFIDRVCGGDKELISYLQRFAGYCLTGSTKEEMLSFWYGTGANGKSKFNDVLAGILGSYHEVVPVSVLLHSRNDQHPTGVAGLAGARMVSADETEEGRSWNETLIKGMVGGGKLKARFMGKDFFEFIPRFKIVVIGNNKPSLRTVDEAWKRRFQIVPFAVTIPKEERDPELGEKLKAEWPGIFHWMIKGCVAWQKERLSPPDLVLNASGKYLEDQDTFADFRLECLAASEHDLKSSDAFLAYSNYCKKRNEWPGHQKSFNDRMANEGFQRQRSNKGQFFRGLELTDEGLEYRGYIPNF